MGTGSEVQIAVAAREVLEADGVPTRVVSIPCLEWFAEQDEAYRTEVLPPSVRARVSVEAGVPMGWRDFVGDAGRIVGLNHYGASASYSKLYEESGSRRRPSSPPPARASRLRSPPAPAGPGVSAAGWTARPATAEAPGPGRTREPVRRARRPPGATFSPSFWAWARSSVYRSTTYSRDRIRSGNLQSLVNEHSIVGVHHQPRTFFAAAMSGSESYDDQLHALAVRAGGASRRRCAPSPARRHPDAYDLLSSRAPPQQGRPGSPWRISTPSRDTDATGGEGRPCRSS